MHTLGGTAVPWMEVAQLPLDGPTAALVNGIELVLFETAAGIHALERRCPHKFADLSEGTVQGDCLTCPIHEASFGADGSPCEGAEWAGEAVAYPARSDGEKVLVEVPSD